MLPALEGSGLTLDQYHKRVTYVLKHHRPDHMVQPLPSPSAAGGGSGSDTVADTVQMAAGGVGGSATLAENVSGTMQVKVEVPPIPQSWRRPSQQ